MSSLFDALDPMLAVPDSQYGVIGRVDWRHPLPVGWIDSGYTEAEVLEAGNQLLVERGQPPVTAITTGGSPVSFAGVMTVAEVVERVKQLRMDKALRGWLMGVASWGPESKMAARAFVVRAKDQGILG